jgi:hypothetical protein
MGVKSDQTKTSTGPLGMKAEIVMEVLEKLKKEFVTVEELEAYKEKLKADLEDQRKLAELELEIMQKRLEAEEVRYRDDLAALAEQLKQQKAAYKQLQASSISLTEFEGYKSKVEDELVKLRKNITFLQQQNKQLAETTDKAATSYMAMPKVECATKESTKQLQEVKQQVEQLQRQFTKSTRAAEADKEAAARAAAATKLVIKGPADTLSPEQVKDVVQQLADASQTSVDVMGVQKLPQQQQQQRNNRRSDCSRGSNGGSNGNSVTNSGPGRQSTYVVTLGSTQQVISCLVAKGSLERGRKIYVDDFLTPGEMQERRVLAPVRRVLKEKYHMVLTWRRSKLVRVRDGWVDKSSKGPKWIPVSSKEIVMGEDVQQGSSQQGDKQ